MAVTTGGMGSTCDNDGGTTGETRLLSGSTGETKLETRAGGMGSTCDDVGGTTVETRLLSGTTGGAMDGGFDCFAFCDL